jgi:metallo-beta-lactamase family protein
MRVKLQFLGAADGVSGSRSLVEYEKLKLLVDCGLFQGPKPVRDRNREPFAPSPKLLDGIVLTHAHLDHSGYLPRICKEGFDKKVFCTQGTADLGKILLRDAAYLEEEFARYANEAKYSHHNPAIPLFTQQDAEKAIERFHPMERHVWHDLFPNVKLRFLRGGHIIGAGLAQLEFSNTYAKKTITFSGDLGHTRSFILRGPEEGVETDILVLESTYGNREHPKTDVLTDFAEIINRTFKRGGVLVIPAFAVGRAQEIIYMIRLLEDQKRVPVVPVILDSPMAVAAMEVCLNHHEDRLTTLGNHGLEYFKPQKFEITTTPEDSMMACMRDGPMIVISASGMLSGGRILHHLKARLPDEKNTILFCGYQAEGTKGRFLQENAETVKELRIFHQPVPIVAEIATIGQLSAHADKDELLAWISRMRRMPKTIILNHGSPEAQKALASDITKRFGINVIAACEQKTVLIE